MPTKKKPQPAYLTEPATEFNWDAGDAFLTSAAQAQPEAAKPSGMLRRAADYGVTALKGAIGVPEAVVGMADLVTGGYAGKAAEAVGFRPAEARAILDEAYSPAQKAAFQAVQDAGQGEDFLPRVAAKAGAAISNPSTIAHGIAESLPVMGMGGLVGRGALAVAPRIGAVGAGAIGEGAVTAGQQAEQVRQQTADGLLTGEQALISGGSGALTGALTLGGGSLAKRLGIGDIDTLIAGRGTMAGMAAQKGLVRKTLEGAVSEGVLEELPQSIQEQVATNIALGKPVDEGVDQAAVMGLLSGGVMGGGAAHFGKPGDPIRDQKLGTGGVLANALDAGTEAQAKAADMLALPAPTITVRPDGTAMTTGQRNARAEDTGGIIETGAMGMGRNSEPALVPKEENQAAAQANIEQFAAQRPGMPLGRILAMNRVAQERGTDLTPILHPDGQGYMLIPSQFITADMRAAAEQEVAERTGRIKDVIEQPAGLVRQKSGDGVEIDPVQAYINSRGAEGTPAARAFTQDVQAGRITRDEVAALMARRPETADDRLERAAAQTLPQDELTNRLVRASQQAPKPMRGDILAANGLPFKNQTAAKLAAKKQGGTVVQIAPTEFIVRPEVTDATQPDVRPLEGNGEPGAADAGRGNGDQLLRDGQPEGLGAGAGVAVGEDLPSPIADGVRPALDTAPVAQLTDEASAVQEGAPQGQPAAEPAKAAGGVPAAGSAAVEADGVAGEPINKEWTAFGPESGTKGVPRAEMPQVKAEHRGALVQFLKARDVTHQQDAEVDPATLKPTQAEFSPGKVQKAKEFTGGDRSILVSSDGHVVDGHHQWAAALEQGTPIKVIRLDAPVDQLLPLVREFPSAEAANGATQPDQVATLPLEKPTQWRGPLVKHLTGKGKTLEGYVRNMSAERAKEIDPYTFRKGPGYFIRKERAEAWAEQDPAEAARAVAGLPATPVKPAEPRPVKPKADALRAAGQKLAEQAAADQARERNTNTARRASMAAGADADARKRESIGKTMVNLADAIESGEAKKLTSVTTKAQIETLEQALRRGMIESERDLSYVDRERQKGRAPEPRDISNAKLPIPSWNTGGASADKLLEAIKGKKGSKEVADLLRRGPPTAEMVAGLKRLGVSEKDISYGMGWWNLEAIAELGRLERAGIKSNDDLREALREYLQFRDGPKKEDPIKAAERALIGQKVGLDFFPTPKAVAERMVESADIGPGDRVLEPSGGNGNIADVAKAAGATVEVVEVSDALRNVLEAKGHNLVGRDFLTFEPAEKYDAILMNPPFSNRLDAEHIQHAYGMLKPGGRLVAIAGEGVFNGSDKKAQAFRDWLDENGAAVENLPAGTFKDVQLLATTGANARLIEMVAPAEAKSKHADGAPINKYPSKPAEAVTTTAAVEPVSAPAAKTPTSSRTTAPISDFGQRLDGARKDYAAKLTDAMDVDVSAEPLSKSWPEPDYQKLLDGGADPFAVAFVHAARDEIPTKPQKSWKLNGWVDSVKSLRDMASKMMSGTITPQQISAQLAKPEFARLGQYIGGRAELYQLFGHDKSLKGVTMVEHDYSLYKGKENVRKWVIEQKAKATAFSNWPRELAVGDTKQDVIDEFREKLSTLDLGAKAKGQPQFEIYRRRSKTEYIIGKKIGREHIDLHTEPTAAEARTYMADHLADLEAKLAKYKDTPFERNTENRPRVGDDHRDGAPVTPEVFAETFSFRGVQFGNYVEQSRRQSDLNEAFDGLMDLAAVLGLPPKALSLNGRLGLAFGARGKGGKNAPGAHFEPGKEVINLTKGSGPGSLAHEWWHAVDNYFARQSVEKSTDFVTDGAVTDRLREQMRQAFGLVKRSTTTPTLRARAAELDKRRTTPYWNTPVELSARSFEAYIVAKLKDQSAANDYLANIVDPAVWETSEAMRAEILGKDTPAPSYPYPSIDELPNVRAAFDEFFRTVETKPTDTGVAMFSRSAKDQASATVQQDVDAITKNWANAPEVVVAFDMQDEAIPAEVRKADQQQRSQGAEGTPEGFYHGGKVYILAGQVKAPADAARVLFHETLGHHGLRGAFGPGLGKILDELAQRRRPLVAKKAEQYGLNMSKPEEARMAAEEVLAEMAQTTPEVGWVRRAVAAIRGFLRKAGLRLQLSDDELIRDYLLPARRWVEHGSGRGQVGGGASFSRAGQTDTPEFQKWFGDSKVVDKAGKPLVVYHGTTADFSAFDKAKIQRKAAGAGFYFTSDPAQRGYAEGDGASVMPVYLSIKNPTNSAYEFRTNPAFDGLIFPLTSTPGVTHYAVREPEQIKSAIGNAGTFDPASPDIRFSRSVTSAARGLDAEKIRSVIADLSNSRAGAKVSLWDRTIGTQYAKAEKYGKDKATAGFKAVFERLQKYNEDTSTLANEAADEAGDILPKLEHLSDLTNTGLSKKDTEALAGPVFEGTLKWTRDENGKPVQTDDIGKAGIVWAPEELRSRFKATDKDVKHYEQFRRAVDTSLDQAVAADVLRLAGKEFADLGRLAVEDRAELRAQVMKRLSAMVENATGKAKETAQQLADDIRDKYERIDDLKSRGYTPLMRFGRYKVNIVKGGETVFFGLYESPREANMAARALQEDPQFKGATFERGMLSEEAFKLMSQVPVESLEMFADALGTEESAVFKEYIRLTKNNRSALKRMLQRKGTAGFSQDARRVLASFVVSNARLASQIMHMGEARKAADTIRAGDVQDEAVKLIDAVQNPRDTMPVARGLLFTHFIGGSIASALVNVTQPITMTLPYLSQWGGMAKASARLVAASKLAAQVVAGKTVADKDLAAALKRAEDDGIVRPQEIHHLMAEASGALGKTDALRKLAFVWGMPFSLAEQFNRQASFIAAWQTAKAEGIADPFAFAEKAVTETQGLYNSGNRANWARNPVGAVVLTFKQFSVHYLEWLGRMYKSGPEGKKAAAWAIAILVLAAGADGIPFAGDLDDAVDTIGQALGYDFSLRRARHDFARSVLGDTLGDVVTRGLSSVPGVPFDVSARMGMADLIPASGLFLKSTTDASREVAQLGGAAGSLLTQYRDAGKAALSGDVAGAAQSMLPVALKNAMTGMLMAVNGEARDTKGRRVMETDLMDATMKGIGLQPQKLAGESYRMGLIRRGEDLAKAVEGEIVDDWTKGIRDQDTEAVKAARARLDDWNAKNPEAPIVITPQQIRQRLRNLSNSRADRFIKSVSPERRAAVRAAMEEAGAEE